MTGSCKESTFFHLWQLLALNIFLSQVMKHEGVIIFTILHFFQGEILYVSGSRSALLILVFKLAISENKNSNNKSTLNLQNDKYLIQLERELEWFPLSSAIGNNPVLCHPRQSSWKCPCDMRFLLEPGILSLLIASKSLSPSYV